MSALCPDCGLPSWDAAYLEPGELVCSCDLDDVADAECPCGNGCWDEPGRPIVTIDTGGLL